MKSFEPGFIEGQPITQNLLRTVRLLGEYKGKEELFKQQIPQALETLRKAGDVIKVDECLEAKALRRNVLFHQLLQALIELAPAGSEERSLLESISNHVVARGVAAEQMQRRLPGI